jgi:hypothetical protein
MLAQYQGLGFQVYYRIAAAAAGRKAGRDLRGVGKTNPENAI